MVYICVLYTHKLTTMIVEELAEKLTLKGQRSFEEWLRKHKTLISSKRLNEMGKQFRVMDNPYKKETREHDIFEAIKAATYEAPTAKNIADYLRNNGVKA